MKTKLLFTALVTLSLAGFSLQVAIGQQESVQKISAIMQATTVRKSFKPVKASEAELKIINATLPVKTITQTQPKMSTTSIIKPIDVTSPTKNEIWKAGKEYMIKWSGASKDVRISLVSPATQNKPREKYQITGQTPNTGSLSFKVPYTCLIGSKGYVQVESLDGKESGASQSIGVHTQLVDLECQITDAKLVSSKTDYFIYYEKETWFEFNVLIRNNGTMFPVTIREVLVRIIKEPEGVVALQEIWGFSDIYDDYWYHLPEPLKFNIKDKTRWILPVTIPPVVIQDMDINLKSGSYRVEVELDPQNLLHENDQTRDDNKCVNNWVIK